MYIEIFVIGVKWGDVDGRMGCGWWVWWGWGGEDGGESVWVSDAE